MDIQEKDAFKAWFKKEYLGIDNLANQGDEGAITRRDYAYVGWQAAKAQAVPETQQALNDRLLVKSIREHVESHIAEISVNDLFDKGWLAAMKCIQNNIDMLEAQDPTND